MARINLLVLYESFGTADWGASSFLEAFQVPLVRSAAFLQIAILYSVPPRQHTFITVMYSSMRTSWGR